MSTQSLFYENAVPVSAKRHRLWSLAPRRDFGFSQHTNGVPVTTNEFAMAARDYAIVFVSSGDSVRPIVVLGLQNGENRYLTETGDWDARYVPAFVRRYPFILATAPDQKNLVLCIDEGCERWNQEGGTGMQLFDSDGEKSEQFSNIVGFVIGYERQVELTQAFCRKMMELDLLESAAARFNLPTGQKSQLAGFKVVSKAKLKTLSTDVQTQLVNGDGLELIYAHLMSLQNIRAMLDRPATKPVDESPWKTVTH